MLMVQVGVRPLQFIETHLASKGRVVQDVAGGCLNQEVKRDGSKDVKG